MIDEKVAQAEIEVGLSAVCAWCEHFHNGRRDGMVSCGKNCGGPSVGMSFPEYKGPMDGRFATFCFICGKEADSAIEIGGRMVGVCNRKGPGGETCFDKFKILIQRIPNRKVVVKERVVPVVSGEKNEV